MGRGGHPRDLPRPRHRVHLRADGRPHPETRHPAAGQTLPGGHPHLQIFCINLVIVCKLSILTPLAAGSRGRPGIWAAHRGVRGEGGSQLLDRGGGGHARGPQVCRYNHCIYCAYQQYLQYDHRTFEATENKDTSVNKKTVYTRQDRSQPGDEGYSSRNI